MEARWRKVSRFFFLEERVEIMSFLTESGENVLCVDTDGMFFLLRTFLCVMAMMGQV